MNLVEICKETERIARETGLFIAAERKKIFTIQCDSEGRT
jgi:hypothetical protein